MVKVFLVEDEAIIRHGIRDNIDWASHGLNLRGRRATASTAYPLILKAQPDILVTDIKMPFMDGLELSRLVKRRFRARGSSCSAATMNLNMQKRRSR